VEVPFKVLLDYYDQAVELTCNRVLRIIPGKRLVCFGLWDGQKVAVKFFLDPRGSKKHCLREERGIRALTATGIKTPALLLKGLLKPDDTPVLVFRKIDPAMELLAAWQRLDDDSQRGELLGQMIAVIADQHLAGLKQDDLHMGNFVLAGSDIYTVDGGSVDTRHMGKKLSVAESLKNLGVFFAQFSPRFGHLITSAFRTYAEKRGWLTRDDLYARLIKEIRNQRTKRKKNYLKKIYRECSAFICRKSWDHFMVYDRDYQEDVFTGLLANPDAAIESSRLLKNGNTATVALVNAGSLRLVVKRYNIKNAWHALKRSPRPSRAWKSWRNAHRLALRGIPTPKPIAFIEKRWGPFRSKAYFITEYVDGVHLYYLIRSGRMKEKPLQGLIERFVGLLQLFADASMSHGDFKATNFIVAGEQIVFTDLDSMREHRFRWLFRRAFRKDCERLMKNWVDLPEIANTFQKHLLRLNV
jgi:tRNA A-37 threonylcarbamoyl transferase component Bud32